MTPLAYLSRLCLRWGGEIVLLPRDGFFALSFSASQHSNSVTQWSKQNAEYEMGDVCGLSGLTWEYLTLVERNRVITDRIDWAMSIGIVSQDGEPLCTRRA